MNDLKVAIFDEVRKSNIKYVNYSYDELNQLVFHHSTGLRLTYSGFLILKNIFTVYSFEMDAELTARHHIGMDKMSYPYYITAVRFILFSSMDASIIKLCGGVKGFLETSYQIDRTQ